MNNEYISRKLIILKGLESMLPYGDVSSRYFRIYRNELNEVSNKLDFEKYEFDIPYYEICKEVDDIGFRGPLLRIEQFRTPKYREYCRRELFLLKLHNLIGYLEGMLKLD